MAEKGDVKKASGGAMTSGEAKNWEGRLRTEAEAPHKWNAAWGELFNNGIPGDYGERAEYLKESIKEGTDSEVTYKDGTSFHSCGQEMFRKQKFGYFDPLAPENQLPVVKK